MFNKSIMNTAKPITLSCLFVCLLAACAQQSEFSSFYAPQAVDFSGHWEKNYAASDDLNSKFQLFIFDVQRRINARNRGLQDRPISSNTGISNDSLLGLAQITEEITKVALLDITQDTNSISIDRKDNFALSCDYFEEQFVSSQNPFGSEMCGWNGEQLIFQFTLLDGLSIQHQVTLAPDQQQLNITTTVLSNAVSDSFTVSNYYQRYTPATPNYDCIFTITHNNVCSQNQL